MATRKGLPGIAVMAAVTLACAAGVTVAARAADSYSNLPLPSARALQLHVAEAQVTACHQATRDGRRIAVGDKVPPGSRIATGDNGNLVLRFADGSALQFGAGARAQLVDSRVSPDAKVRRVRIRLEQGRADAAVAPDRGGDSRFELHTPAAVIGVRGTRFRTAVSGIGTTLEVLDGRVAVVASRGEVEVSGGFGLLVVPGKPPTRPMPLLPAPVLESISATIDARNSGVRFSRVEGAASYRVTLSLDGAFERIAAQTFTDTPRAHAGGLPAGEYHLRARAIDGTGIEGRDAVGRLRILTGNGAAPAVTELPR